MTYIGTTDDTAKRILLKSWGGTDLVEFMKSHAKVKFEEIPATDTDTDNCTTTIKKIKDELRLLVNRILAMYQLLTTKQGERSWMDFIKDLEGKAHILDLDHQPYRQDAMVKDAAIFGMTDIRLKEKALAEDPDLNTLVRWGQSREAGREEAYNSPICRLEHDNLNTSEIDEMIETLNIMRIKKQCKYSVSSHQSRTDKPQCRNCSSGHPEGRCPAKGKSCFVCGEKDHFANARSCAKGTHTQSHKQSAVQ